MRILWALALILLPTEAWAARGKNKLSKRVQLRYEDVITMRDGTRWRGKLVERGDVFRIKLQDGSVVAVRKEEVEAVTRELNPDYVHNGQWVTNAYAGAEAALQISSNAGARYGIYAAASLGHNFGGTFEPEVFVAMTPIGPEDLITANSIQFGLGTRIYLSPNRRAKPFTETLIVTGGTHYDFGLRSGPGLLWDLSEGFGLGFTQGVTLMVMSEPELLGIGYHIALVAQGRF